MRMLICNCMVFLSVTVLCARDLDGVLLSVLMANRQVLAQSEKPEVKNEILEHAQVEVSAVALPSQAEVLAGQQGDAESVMNNTKGNALEDANIPSSDARKALQERETVEDLKNPVVSGQGPYENESELDWKLSNPNPDSASTLRKAEPTATAG